MQVGCTSLEKIMDNNQLVHIDLVKVDCEGAEFEILYGTPKDYLQKKYQRLEWNIIILIVTIPI